MTGYFPQRLVYVLGENSFCIMHLLALLNTSYFSTKQIYLSGELFINNMLTLEPAALKSTLNTVTCKSDFRCNHAS